MSMLDYGVLVIKNGVPLNKNSGLFMDCPDYLKGTEAEGHYYAYCGDYDLSLCFYKEYIRLVREGKKEQYYYLMFKSETVYLDEFNFTMRRLDELYPVYPELFDGCTSWAEWKYLLINEYGVSKKDLPSCKRLWDKTLKKIHKHKPIYWDNTRKYVCEWEYKGDKWEVIYGYGIDSNEEVFEDIVAQDRYNYKPEGVQYIRDHFFGVKESNHNEP